MERNLGDLGGSSETRAPGWRRWAWIGGGFAVVVLSLALLIGMLSAKRMLSWGMHRICNGVMAALPPELPAGARERIRTELDCVARAAEEGRADEKALGEFARACTSALEDRRLTSLELVRIEALAVAVCLEAGGPGPR
jgi:hypothetical protein